jgi:hypothetical protein
MLEGPDRTILICLDSDVTRHDRPPSLVLTCSLT